MDWWQAYLLTLAVEMPIVLLALRAARIAGHSIPWWRIVAFAWAVNLTHPILWWIRPEGGWLVLAEVIIALVEGLVLWWGCRREWRLSFYLVLAALANTCSVLAGLLIVNALLA